MTVWLFTKYGFYSSVCARQGNGGHDQPADPDRLMIRARVRGHLEALQTRFPAQLATTEISETPATDYRYRMFVDKAVWTPVLVELNEEMEYDNFKSEVARHQGATGAGYEQALHDVWSIMYQLQKQ